MLQHPDPAEAENRGRAAGEKPDHALADLAAEQHGIFTLDDARRVGLSRGQIDRRIAHRWSVVYDGVYRVMGAPVTWRSELRAAVSAAGAGSAVSHRAAAAIYELPGGRPGLVELSCLRWKRSTRPGLIVHESRRLGEADIQELDGLQVARPERVLLDLAWLHPSVRYLELVVQAARRRRLLTYESARATFDRHARRGLRGVATLRQVLDAWDPASRPTESEMETLLVHTLRDHGLPAPTTQFEVLDSTGTFVARVDAAYPDARIAIEYDSMQEHSDEFQLARDARRRNAVQTAGFVVLSARKRELRRGGDELAQQIQSIMRRARTELA